MPSVSSVVSIRDKALKRDDDFPDDAILHVSACDPMSSPSPSDDRWFLEMSKFSVRRQNSCLVGETLYYKCSDGIWQCCVHSDEKQTVLREAHRGIAGGHYAGDTITQKIW